MKKRIQSISTLFWLNRQRLQRGKATIYLRVSVQGKRIELATQHHVAPDHWDNKTHTVKDRSPDAEFINGQLSIMKAEFFRHFNVLMALDKPVSAEILKKAYLGISHKQSTIKELLTFYITRFGEKVATGKKANNSLKCLKSTEKKITEFLKYRFRSFDLPLTEIKPSFSGDLEHYLTTVDKVGDNTAMKYIKIGVWYY